MVGRGHFASASFSPARSGPSQAGDISNKSLEEICQLASDESAVLILDGEPSLRAQAAELLSGSAVLASAPLSCSRASLVAEIATDLLAAGATPSAITDKLVYAS